MELIQFNSEQKFSSLFLVEQINIFRKEDNKSELAHFTLLAKIENEFEEEINDKKFLVVEYKDKKGEMRKSYELNFEQSLQILMSESKTVRKRVIDVLKEQQAQIKKLQLHSYQIEDPIKRAEKWIEEQKEKQQLLLKAENLETVLDNLLEWVSIIKVAQFNKVSEKCFNWHLLKAKSKELGYQIKKAESPRFGFQNLYHIDCFKAVYPQFNYNLKK